MNSNLETMALQAVADWAKPIAQNDLLALIQVKAGIPVGEAWDVVEALLWAKHLDYDPCDSGSIWHITESGRAQLEATP